jgi:hypothetical protein
MRCLSLVLLLLSCQDYNLAPDRSDSGSPLPEEDPGGPIGVLPLPDLELGNRDSTPPPCILEPRSAQAFSGDASCTPMEDVSWGLALEREIEAATSAGGFHLASGAVAPGPSEKVLVFATSHTKEDTLFTGFDPESGEVAVAIGGLRQAWGGPTVVRGSRPDTPLRAAVALAGDNAVALVNIDEELANIPADIDQCASVLGRDVLHAGQPVFVTGNRAYRPDGTIALSFHEIPSATLPSISDTDGDGHDEIFNAKGWWDAQTNEGVEWQDLYIQLVGGVGYRRFFASPIRWRDAIHVSGHDGASHFTAEVSGVPLWLDPPENGFGPTTVGLPSLGDIDGDGEPELVSDLYGTTIYARDLDGTVLWTRETSTGETLANVVSMADLDADGVYEVLVWSTMGLWILNGPDGETLAHWDTGYHGTWLRMPLVADVDADGSAEIVVIGRREADPWAYTPRIFILGPAQGRWARTRPVWNQLSYDVTSVRDDGRVPAFPRANHETYNSWRAQPAHDGDHPDLEIEVLETCRDEAAGTVQIHSVVHNRGSKDAPAGAVLRLMSWDETLDLGLQDQASHTIADPIPSMTSAQGVVFEVTTEQWATRQVVQVDGAHDDECDFVNDRVDVWEE